MKEIEARLSALEDALTQQTESIPVEQRWWLDLAETPAEREQWASEPTSWTDVETAWDAACTALYEKPTAALTGA